MIILNLAMKTIDKKQTILIISLLVAIFLSVLSLSYAATPNPGHPWTETGDGNFVVTGQTAPRVFTFPDANATILTTNNLVTVAQGGTGASSLTGILIGNGTSAFTATTSPGGLLVGTSASQALALKTIFTGNNTITDTGAAVGDLFRFDGTRFARFARGSANQLLRNNDAGSDLEWATISSSPSGSDTWLQYNDAGAFGASSSLAWASSTKSLNLNGYLDLTTSSNPAIASAGSIRLFNEKFADKEMLSTKSDDTDDYSVLQSSIYQNSVTIFGGGNNAITNIGGQPVTSGVSSGVRSQSMGNLIASLDTTAVLNNVSYLYDTTARYYRGSLSGRNGYFFFARVGTNTLVTSTAYWAGLTDVAGTSILASDNSAGSRSGFTFSTALGETNWMFENKAGGAVDRNSTGILVDVNKVYDLYFYTPPRGTVVNWRIDNLTDATTAEGSSVTSLPTSTVAMRIGVAVRNNVSSTRSLIVGKVYVEVPR